MSILPHSSPPSAVQAWFFLAGAIILEVGATSLLNCSEGFHRPAPTIGALALYGCAFFCLSQALKSIPLGLAYAIWCGFGIICIAVIGLVVFRQQLSLGAYLGIGLIIIGTVIASLNGPASTVP